MGAQAEGPAVPVRSGAVTLRPSLSCGLCWHQVQAMPPAETASCACLGSGIQAKGQAWASFPRT